MSFGESPESRDNQGDSIDQAIQAANARREELLRGGKLPKRSRRPATGKQEQRPTFFYTIGREEGESKRILDISDTQKEAKRIGDNFLKSLRGEGHYCIAKVVYIRRRERSIKYRLTTD